MCYRLFYLIDVYKRQLPAWDKRLSYMKSEGAGNKAHLQPVTHFLVHIGIGIARVVFQRAGTKDVYKRQIYSLSNTSNACAPSDALLT